MSITDMCIHI